MKATKLAIIVGILILGGSIFVLILRPPLTACPLIAPSCEDSKEECSKAAKSLEEQYPGCQYTQICESCKYGEGFIAEGCFVGGCAGEVCNDEPVGQWYCFWYDPKWACYKTARCEKQADGKCGWTWTVELEECLEKAERELREKGGG